MATTPIVTEVTKAQLDALVAANGLNEGLQYKVTDKNWLLIATGANLYEFASIPYKSFIAGITTLGTTDPDLIVMQNTIGELTFTRVNNGIYNIHSSANAFKLNKTFIIANSGIENEDSGLAAVVAMLGFTNSDITFTTICTDGIPRDNCLSAGNGNCIEIRVYL